MTGGDPIDVVLTEVVLYFLHDILPDGQEVQQLMEHVVLCARLLVCVDLN